MPGLDNCADKGFARKHNNICYYLDVDTKSKYKTSKDQSNHFYKVILRIYPEKQIHGKVNEVSKGNGYRYLKNILYLKVFS